MKHRDVSENTKHRLEELLLSGYGPAAALTLLKLELKLEDPDNYVHNSGDRARCPDKQYVYRLQRKLFAQPLGRSSSSCNEEKMIAVSTTYAIMSETVDDTDRCACDKEDTCVFDQQLHRFDTMIADMREKMIANKNSFSEPLEMMLKSYDRIQTESELQSAVSCFGRYTGVSLPSVAKKRKLVKSQH